MPYQIGANVGFVTNSSSMVYHFPKTLLEHEGVKAMMAAFEFTDGFVGSDMWSRNRCGSVAIHREDKLAIQAGLQEMNEEDTNPGPTISVDDDTTFVVVFGDEHTDLAHVFARMLQEIAKDLGIVVSGNDYN